MKLKQTTIFILSLLILSSGLWSQTAEEVVNKCIAAHGGEKAIKNFSDFKAKGEMNAFFGQRQFKGKLTLIRKEKKYRMRGEITFGSRTFSVIRAYDGTGAWTERMGTIADQPALNYRSDAHHIPALLLEKDAAFLPAKETEIEGKKAIGLEVGFKGKKTMFFIDRKDYTILEIRYRDLYFGSTNTKEMLEKRIRYLDYKKTSGVLFPFKMVFYEKGKKNLEINLSEISFNPKVSPDMFKRPDQEPDLRYWEERIH